MKLKDYKSAIINGKNVLIANFKYEERRGEEDLYMNWFSNNGYSVGRIPSEFKFEGRGDAFVHNNYLVGSYGIRSDKEALLFIAEEFQLEPLIVELAQEKFYHLDTCFQQLPSGDAIFYPEIAESTYFFLMLVVIMTALMGAIYPAIKAVNLKPLEAIRKV